MFNEYDPSTDTCGVYCLQCEGGAMEKINLSDQILRARIDVQDICASSISLCGDCGTCCVLTDENCVGIFPVCDRCAAARREHDMRPEMTCFAGHSIDRSREADAIVFTARVDKRLSGFYACKDHREFVSDLPQTATLDEFRLMMYGGEMLL